MWQKPSNELPDEETLVVAQVRGEVRENYYRIEGSWYDLADLNRWRMNTSQHWWHYQTLKKDRKKKKRKAKRRKT